MYYTGAVEWTLPLTPWWASVLPALARHHHHQQLQQQSSSTNTTISSTNNFSASLLHHQHPISLHRQSQQHLSTSGAVAPFLHPPPPSTSPPTLLSKIKNERGNTSAWPGLAKIKSERSGHGWLGAGGGSRENSSPQWSQGSRGLSSGSGSPNQPVVSLAGLDQLSLVTALGKEVSPQMVQALQAVATRRESFSSAAKLYSVSVTTLWRYFKKLNLSDAQKNANAAAAAAVAAAAVITPAASAAPVAATTTFLP